MSMSLALVSVELCYSMGNVQFDMCRDFESRGYKLNQYVMRIIGEPEFVPQIVNFPFVAKCIKEAARTRQNIILTKKEVEIFEG